MSARIDVRLGTRFGRLVTIAERQVNVVTIECRCDCGELARPWIRSLTSGQTKSCGCLRDEKSRARATKHGQAGRMDGTRRTPTYGSWVSMRKRCLDANDPGYKNYGARGITICERWPDFANFLADMGEKPKGLSLDRIDNDGNYEPGNCRWATWSQQMRNRRLSATRWSREGPRDARGRLLPSGPEHCHGELRDAVGAGEAVAA